MTAQECHALAGEIDKKFDGVDCWYDPINHMFKLNTNGNWPIQVPVAYYQALWGFAVLIQPSIPADPGEAGLACVDAFIREHTEKPVDLVALLALADEMDELCGPWHDCGKHYARRIREALGIAKAIAD